MNTKGKIYMLIGLITCIFSSIILISFSPEPHSCISASHEEVLMQMIPVLTLLGGIVLIALGLSELDFI